MHVIRWDSVESRASIADFYEALGNEYAKKESCTMTTSYRPERGALLFASTMSRPDITTAVRMLAQRMDKPTQNVAIGIKRVMQYLQGTRDLALKYSANNAKGIGSGVWMQHSHLSLV